MRKVFEQVLARCIAEGAVGGEAFAVDASTIRADTNRERGASGKDGVPPDIMHRRAVREYIETLDDAAFGGATDTVPKYVSLVDPAARWTRTRNDGSARYSYSVNDLIDCKHAVIRQARTSGAIVLLDVWLKPNRRGTACTNIEPSRAIAIPVP